MAFDAGEVSVRISADITDLSRELNRAVSEIERGTRGFTNAGRELSRSLTLPLAALGAGALKASLDFEQAMAGVAKTVDAPASEIRRLGKEFQAMSETIPVSANQLANLGQAAGQLGVKTENIQGFVRVMADLGVSTNLSADEAATALARLANITQLPQTSFDRLGSTIVALGNNFATTERDIVAFGLRIAGAGKQIGLTESEMLAFGTALSSVGVEAEAGGTAISRVFIELANAVADGGDKLDQFAKVAGTTMEDFAQQFKTNAAEATISFIEGLRGISEAGDNVFGVLDQLGLGNIRVRDALLRAAGAGDILREAVVLGNKAWQDNNALSNEATKFYATMKNQLVVLKNQVINVAAELGNQLRPALQSVIDIISASLGVLRSLIAGFDKLPDPIKNAVVAFVGLAAAIGPVLFALGTFKKTMALVGVGAKALAAVLGLELAPLLGPAGLIAAGIAVIAGLFITFRSRVKETTQSIEEFKTSVSTITGAQAQNQIDNLRRALRDAEADLDRFSMAARAAGDTPLGADLEAQARRAAAAVFDMRAKLGLLEERVRDLQSLPPIVVDIGVSGLNRAVGQFAKFEVAGVGAFQQLIDKQKELESQLGDLALDRALAKSSEEAGKVNEKFNDTQRELARVRDLLRKVPDDIKRIAAFDTITIEAKLTVPTVKPLSVPITPIMAGGPLKGADIISVKVPVEIEGFGETLREAPSLMEAFTEGLTSTAKEFDTFKPRLKGLSATAAEVGQGLRTAFVAAFDFAKGLGEGLLEIFNPLSIAGTVLDQAFRDATGTINERFKVAVEKISGIIGDALQPVIEAMIPVFDALAPIVKDLAPILSALAQILAALFKAIAPILHALVPILRALFPVIKLVAIILTYLGQIFAKAAQIFLYVVSGFAKVIGVIVEAIGRAIDALPFISAKRIINAGKDLQHAADDFKESGDLMGDAFRDLGDARDEIRNINIEDSFNEAATGVDQLGNSASDAAAAIDYFGTAARNARFTQEATDGTGSTTGQTVTIGTGVNIDKVEINSTTGDPEEIYAAFRSTLITKSRGASPGVQDLAFLLPA